MARPRAADAAWLRDQGIRAVLSLTEAPPPELEGIETFHEPVPDMTPPSLDQLHRVVAYIDGVLNEGGAVVVHCAAGMGRTGTILAAYLVSRGHAADEAIGAVRRARPGSIETAGQVTAVRQFAQLMGADS